VLLTQSKAEIIPKNLCETVSEPDPDNAGGGKLIMKIFLNGTEHAIASSLTIEALLQTLQIPSQQIAVAVNNEVVSRAAFHEKLISDGDKIDILRAVAGG